MPHRPDATPTDALLAAAEQYGVGRIVRHVFLCADQTEPKCAPRERTLLAWEYLKRRIAELGLGSGDTIVFRSKANCLKRSSLCSRSSTR